MKDPAFLLYYESFMNGTKYLTHEQVGAYTRLLCEQADMGHLSLATIELVIGKDRMVTVWSAIASKFITDQAGLYYNERLERELIKRRKYCESRSHKDLSAGGDGEESSRTETVREAYDNRTRNRNRDRNKDKEPVVIKKKHSFQESPFFDKESFKVALSPWPIEKIKYYYEQACGYSEANGGKYLNWIAAIKNWDRMKPYEQRGKPETRVVIHQQPERIEPYHKDNLSTEMDKWKRDSSENN